MFTSWMLIKTPFYKSFRIHGRSGDETLVRKFCGGTKSNLNNLMFNNFKH